MATRTWLGVDGNWNNTSNWSGGSVPTNGDDVEFTSGSQSVTSNLNQSAVALNSLKITDEYSGAIGTSGGALQIDATDVYLAGQSATTGYYLDGTYTNVHVTDGITTSAAEGVVLDGAITTLRAYAGKIAIADGADVTTIDTRGASTSGLQLTVGASVTSLTDVRAVGCSVTLGSACTNLWVKSGTVSVTEGALTRVEIDGGTLTHTADDNIGTVRHYAGTVDFSDNVTGALTITTYEAWAGTLRIDNGLGGPTFTNGIRVHNQSFKILRDGGQAAA